MTLRRVLFVLVAGFAAAVCVGGAGRVLPDASAQPPDMPPPARAPGYLGRDGIPDHLLFLPPPPAEDSALGTADVALFHATRALENTARWRLAASDAEIGREKTLRDFACALGVDLTSAETPALARLLARASADLVLLVGAAKDHYQRPRPFLTEQGPVCVGYSEEFAKSGSYPSGHAASGWMHALLFAEVDADSTAAILARGRAFGESRVVCGMHYLTDVDAGRTAASALVAALHGNAEFEADLAAARAEVAALEAAAAATPDSATCAVEQAELRTPW
jgi:acid phosphatase (class A)